MFTFTFMIVAFVIGYTVIALEHPLKINKTATALLLGVLLWVCAVVGGDGLLVSSDALRAYTMSHPGSTFTDWLVHSELLHALGDIAEILFFLMGAMTIVEIIDTNGGFRIITDHIHTLKKTRLLWIVGILTFFMSAVLDNLTTSIVMVALLRKLMRRNDRILFDSVVIIAANAGGAWSPIGDVTTIMLWISSNVTAGNIIAETFIASLVSLIVPLLIFSFILKGDVEQPTEERHHEEGTYVNSKAISTLFLCVGVGVLVFVPVFKTLTHLPPYMGMLGGLGILWVMSEIIHRPGYLEVEQNRKKYSILAIISKIDLSSIMFFLGILLAVNALKTVGHLALLANGLDGIKLPEPSKYYVINIIIGVLSSIVDNVPLVAGSMGMYHFPTDHYFWEMLAYCAGTGGSILIIGSAAGVAIMGLDKIDFIWYLKRISWVALVGYLCGAGAFIGQKTLVEQFAHKEKTENVVEMTADGVEDFLFKSTFYLSQDTPEFRDSLTVNFIRSNDGGKDLLGFHCEQIAFSKKDNSILGVNMQNQLAPGEFDVQVEGDTTALVKFADMIFEVTPKGELFQWDLDAEGIYKTEWKRK